MQYLKNRHFQEIHVFHVTCLDISKNYKSVLLKVVVRIGSISAYMLNLSILQICTVMAKLVKIIHSCCSSLNFEDLHYSRNKHEMN